MKKMFAPLFSYLQKREKSEQIALVAGSTVVFFYLIYMLIYSPIQTTLTEQRAQLQEKQETLTWIKKVRPQIQSSQARPIQTTELLSTVQQTLSQPPFQSFPNQLNQTNTSDVEIKFAQVPFNALLKWMWNLNERYQVNIKLFEAQLSETPGVCQAHLIISSLSTSPQKRSN